MTEEEKMEIQLNRPHLVILGAGASVEAIINGDRNGRKLSGMKGFINNLGLNDLFLECQLAAKGDNLEDIYSELDSRPECEHIKKELEERIFNEFIQYELPEEMTVYDYLILSLRKKDLIASFNWDPLLVQAYGRMSRITDDLPELVFLHGNVYAGYCESCKSFGRIHNRCNDCKTEYTPSKLLYPIKNKEYDKDPFIVEQWKRVRRCIGEATIVTFFGYSAPESDVAAINLLRNIYNNGIIHRFDMVEIIDIDSEEKLKKKWGGFIEIEGAYPPAYISSFYESHLAKFPRRSIESYAKINFKGWWGTGKNKIEKNGISFEELDHLISPLIKKEQELNYIDF